MTSRLRELIQQLGEAIHESVIESEQIAGVVQTIREHGFDVLIGFAVGPEPAGQRAQKRAHLPGDNKDQEHRGDQGEEGKLK